jgi:hypothetical protein
MHEWELVAIGVNNSWSNIVKSTSYARLYSPFPTLASWYFSCSSSFAFLGFASISSLALCTLLRFLSKSGSKGVNSKFKDHRPCIH